MAVSKQITVLKVGEIEKGKSTYGAEWVRCSLQVWSGDIAGRIPVYDTEENLKKLVEGNYTADYVERNGDNGSILITFGNLQFLKQQQPQKP